MAASKLRATQTFACTVGKVEYLIREGDELPAGHPVTKARREFFEPQASRRRKAA
jgi:hypothetical protein